MQAIKKEEMFSKDPDQTYSLMAIVEGESFQVEKGPEDTVHSWPHLISRELLLFLGGLHRDSWGLPPVQCPPGRAGKPAAFDQSGQSTLVFRRDSGTGELFSLPGRDTGFPTAIVVSLFLLPYLDRNPQGVGVWFSPKRKGAILIFSIFVVTMVVLILIGEFIRGPNWALYWPWQNG